jgi:hypothetical protein
MGVVSKDAEFIRVYYFRGKSRIVVVLQFWYEPNWTKGGFRSKMAKSAVLCSVSSVQLFEMNVYSCRGSWAIDLFVNPSLSYCLGAAGQGFT